MGKGENAGYYSLAISPFSTMFSKAFHKGCKMSELYDSVSPDGS